MTAAEENVTENVKAPMFLKVLVVVLGLAIVGMLGLIIVKVVAGDHKKTPAETGNKNSETVVSVPVRLPEELEVARPENSELKSFQNTNNGLMLHFTNEEADVLIFIDSSTGEESRITIPK